MSEQSSNSIEQRVLNHLKFANGGVCRDEIEEEFGISGEHASDLLRSLRYQGLVSFDWDNGVFRCAMHTDVEQ